jgi:hypothetical protein
MLYVSGMVAIIWQNHSIPGQSMWDLWWTKWQWDTFFPCQFHSTGAQLLRKTKKKKNH